MVVKVEAYDPNLMNPYGYELTAIIAGPGRPVTRWCAVGRDRPPAPGVTERPVLAADRASGPLWRVALGRLLGPLRFLASAGSNVALIVWVRDPWDALLFWLRAALRFPTVVVYHNPRQVRPRGGLVGRIELALLRKATTVVHNDFLAKLAAEDVAGLLVAPHPPFSQTVARQPGLVAQPRDRHTFALVGGLRRDKGVDQLEPIAAAAGRPWTLRIIGPDQVEPELVARLAELQVTVEHYGGNPPSDEEVLHGLATSTSLIAPYTAVTASSTIYLALTLGVPVISYGSPSLAKLLKPTSLVAGPQEMGAAIDRFADDPWPTNAELPEEQSATAKVAWAEVIARASRR